MFVCNLILPRLILSNYGSAYNGMVSSITQFLNLVSLLRLGVAGAVRASLYKPLAEKNKEKTGKIVKASQLFMKRICADHVHLCLSIPPNEKVSDVVGYIKCELPVNLRLKSIYQHKYWIFCGNIGEPVVVNTH